MLANLRPWLGISPGLFSITLDAGKFSPLLQRACDSCRHRILKIRFPSAVQVARTKSGARHLSLATTNVSCGSVTGIKVPPSSPPPNLTSPWERPSTWKVLLHTRDVKQVSKHLNDLRFDTAVRHLVKFLRCRKKIGSVTKIKEIKNFPRTDATVLLSPFFVGLFCAHRLYAADVVMSRNSSL